MSAADALPTLVTTEWLAAHLGASNLRVVDATWYLPHLNRDARAEYRRAHVPGAVFFDIDEIKDATSPLPHMLPDAAAFARAVGALGIGDGDRVVVYGARGFIASARVWWSFRAFGHDKVGVLDGGFPAWRFEGRPLESALPSPEPRRFTARGRPELVRGLEAMRANVATRREQVVDARSHGRFAGAEPEPRPGLRSGHIPGSVSLPYDRIVQREGGALLPPAALREAFEKSGLDLARPDRHDLRLRRQRRRAESGPPRGRTPRRPRVRRLLDRVGWPCRHAGGHVRGARSRGAPNAGGVWGAMSGPPCRCRVIEERPGFAGVLRTRGGMGGHVGAPHVN